MMRVHLHAVLGILVLFGLPKKSHANAESDGYYVDDYYYPPDYYPEPEPEKPTLISSQKLSEIENITQHIVIRLIKRENRMMSKNMEGASERCVKLGAVFEEKCAKCQAIPDLTGPILMKSKELSERHPIYVVVELGKKIVKGLKRIRVRKIVKHIGKDFKRLGKKIGEAWRNVGSKVRRTLGRITRQLRRLVRVRLRLPKVRVRLPTIRVRLPRIKLPRVRVRLPRVRLPRVRVRLPRVRLPRVRVRLPRIRYPRIRYPRIRYPRVRVRFGRSWGKKKRSTCGDCERMAKMNEQDRINSLCPFLLSENKKSLQTDKFLKAITSEVESGFPKLEKILHYQYLSSDEADVTISAKEGKHSYKLKNFSKLSSEQIGRMVGRYIFNKAKSKQ
ncbi:uncharacterized protein [Magallana gigas]|uniref:uncharacterized protein n=1 Tax=Magallana gigas TaxID=29159 RepID=UPI00333F1283